MPMTGGSLTTVGSPLRMFQGTEAQHVTGWNITSLGDDLMKIRGHGQSGESLYCLPISHVDPLKQPRLGLSTDVESCGDTAWTSEIICLDHPVGYFDNSPMFWGLSNFD
ncbi:hypothetical protein BDR04DRAFT_1103417 [Suillus decipiens]|nr:hypothetical protein BDR04DRAFT_1103417 [Suillus decipiens]